MASDSGARLVAGGLTRKGAQTRQRIVAAAADLILQQGVAGTTLDDVRAEAGVSSSQIYHYFADKEALVRAVIDYRAETLVGEIRKPRAARAAAHSGRSAASSPSSTTSPGTTSRQDAAAGKQRSGPAWKVCATAVSSSRPQTLASSPRPCSPRCKAGCSSPRSNAASGRSPPPST